MANGVVKKKMDGKFFGFIASPGMPKDVFFYKDSLVGITFDQLNEGDPVTFDTEESPKGLNAKNVQKAN